MQTQVLTNGMYDLNVLNCQCVMHNLSVDSFFCLFSFFADYLTSKSKSTLAVNDTDDAKKKRSGTNMFKAQRNRLVESVDTEKETSGGKPNTGAWLQMEREKTLMQEERLKLEREKRQFEEEREKFEREKRQMRMEMARLKQ